MAVLRSSGPLVEFLVLIGLEVGDAGIAFGDFLLAWL